MDEQAAKDFCRTQLHKRGFPPNIELEDLTQEYHLAYFECDKAISQLNLIQEVEDAFRSYYGIEKEREGKCEVCHRMGWPPELFENKTKYVRDQLRELYNCKLPEATVLDTLKSLSDESSRRIGMNNCEAPETDEDLSHSEDEDYLSFEREIEEEIRAEHQSKMKAACQNALAILKPKDAIIFKQARVEGLPLSKIAHQHNMTVSGIKASLARTRRLLDAHAKDVGMHQDTNLATFNKKLAAATVENETLGEMLRRIRGNDNQTDFAQKIHVSRETVSSWEKGKSKPTNRHMELIRATYPGFF